MFIEQAFKAKNNTFIYYLLGSAIVVFGATLGQLPWLFAIVLKMFREDDGKNDAAQAMSRMSTMNESDFMCFLDKNLSLFLLLFSFVVGFAFFYFVIKFIHKQKLLELTTTRPKFDWGRAFFAFGMVSIFAIATTALDYYLSPESYVVNFDLGRFLLLAVIAITLIPIQTSLEEYLFRGYLMQGFGMWARNKWFPLLITSLIFGGLHMANPEVVKMGYIVSVSYIGAGLLLGIMTLMDEGMELSLGFHAGNNLIIALLVTTDWGALRTDAVLTDISEPTAGWDIIIPVLIVYPIFLAILAYRYKWTGWKEKLFGKVIEPEPTQALEDQVEDYRVAD